MARIEIKNRKEEEIYPNEAEYGKLYEIVEHRTATEMGTIIQKSGDLSFLTIAEGEGKAFSSLGSCDNSDGVKLRELEDGTEIIYRR